MSTNYRLVLVSHGKLAQSMLDSAHFLLGDLDNIAAYGLERDMRAETLRDMLETELMQFGEEKVLFLSDMRNGTPFNVVTELMREHRIYHITGMNLPLVLNAATLQKGDSRDLQEVCRRLIRDSTGSIFDVGELFREL